MLRFEIKEQHDERDHDFSEDGNRDEAVESHAIFGGRQPFAHEKQGQANADKRAECGDRNRPVFLKNWQPEMQPGEQPGIQTRDDEQP